ncbi:hypothetical protein ABT093_11860 [Kitasatospora sp. NPDC002551]
MSTTIDRAGVAELPWARFWQLIGLIGVGPRHRYDYESCSNREGWPNL